MHPKQIGSCNLIKLKFETLNLRPSLLGSSPSLVILLFLAALAGSRPRPPVTWVNSIENTGSWILMPRPGRWAQLIVNNFKMLIGIRTSQRNNNILTSAQCLAANPGYSIIEVSASMLNCSLIKCVVFEWSTNISSGRVCRVWPPHLAPLNSYSWKLRASLVCSQTREQWTHPRISQPLRADWAHNKLFIESYFCTLPKLTKRYDGYRNESNANHEHLKITGTLHSINFYVML